MRKLILLTILFFIIFLSSCSTSKQADIVTTAFFQYDFASQIVGDKMTVSLLVNPGQEIHKYEVTSKDRVAIKGAKLFLFTSLEIDQSYSDPYQMAGKDTVVMDLSAVYAHIKDDNHVYASLTLNNHNLSDHDDDEDIHYWVDPLVAIELINAIYEQIILIDPKNKDYYEAHKDAYVEKIVSLHQKLTLLIATEGWQNKSLYFAGHNALGLFAKRYEIHILSIYTDFKPEQDTLSSEMISFSNELKLNRIKYLMIEELVQPLVANKIKDSLQKDGYTLTLLELHAYHNVTKEDFIHNISYADLFERNINHIEIAFRGI